MQFRDRIEQIPQDDSTDPEEKMILYRDIKKLKPKVILETGTHRGKTTLYMAHALFENGGGHIYTADPYPYWCQLHHIRMVPELEPFITYFEIPGIELADKVTEKVDFMFIDGFHEKHEVLAEIDALFPLLNDGAVVYFHDTNGSNPSCDVPGAIKERGLKVEQLKTLNGMMRYEHNSSNSKPKTNRSGNSKGKSSKTDV